MDQDNSQIKTVDNFVYLGSNISSTEKDVQFSIAKAWQALNGLSIVWKSSLSDSLKRAFFRATVQSVLLYGSSTWTLTRHLENRLDGTFTKMLRSILNVTWKDHPTKRRLYGSLPPVSSTIREQRLRFAGHCWRSKNEIVSDLVLWRPSHGFANRGRPRKTYIDQLTEDTNCKLHELKDEMDERPRWKRRVFAFRHNISFV